MALPVNQPANVVAESSDDEFCSEAALGFADRRTRWRAVVACSIGAAAIVLGTLVVVMVLPAPMLVASTRSSLGDVSVLDFLESRRLADVVSDNFVRMIQQQGFRAAPSLDVVRSSAQLQLARVGAEILQRAPALHAELGATPLTGEQQQAMLQVLSRMSDPRLQQLGRRLAEVSQPSLQASAGASAGAETGGGLLQSVAALLGPQLEDLRRLREDIVPACLRQPTAGADSAPAPLGVPRLPRGMRLLESFRRWRLEVDITAPRTDVAPLAGSAADAAAVPAALRRLFNFNAAFASAEAEAASGANAVESAVAAEAPLAAAAAESGANAAASDVGAEVNSLGGATPQPAGVWDYSEVPGEFVESQVGNVLQRNDRCLTQLLELPCRFQVYVKEFPQAYSILIDNSYFNKFKKCASQQLEAFEFSATMTCCSTYAQSAMDAVESSVQQGVSALPSSMSQQASAFLNPSVQKGAASSLSGFMSSVLPTVASSTSSGLGSLFPDLP